MIQPTGGDTVQDMHCTKKQETQQNKTFMTFEGFFPPNEVRCRFFSLTIYSPKVSPLWDYHASNAICVFLSLLAVSLDVLHLWDFVFSG